MVVKKFSATLFANKYYLYCMAKKKIEQLTPKQYADYRGVSLSSVTECIRRQWNLPAVIKVQKFGRFYVLEVDMNQLKIESKK
jgi:hypothetical protein